jgi:hypothetical protein
VAVTDVPTVDDAGDPIEGRTEPSGRGGPSQGRDAPSDGWAAPAAGGLRSGTEGDEGSRGSEGQEGPGAHDG